MTNLKTSTIRLFDDVNPPKNSRGEIICFCGENLRKFKGRWLSHLHDKHQPEFNDMLSEQRVKRAQERMLVEQVRLVDDDEDEDEEDKEHDETKQKIDHEEKRRKYFELFETLKNGTLTLEQYEAEHKKVQQQ
ncbi:unnamed protein product [Rotaria magnacalcarata]|uniref:Uncharacterized protein n=1 Tax=Rotaria magnacalcarata TaxID=392030 RepID=A0A815LNI3_9BILA|nr:unnamed protein product [Rotaria magnacalcarata]CAF1412541.1 unnamed protein product [Rotaria magnacalcarata]CAF2060095.1 unnamed protein product [Rotaria magnacalcarata]CAF3921518.1 unnamed protein product [Rotaria magnacalcarata]CAF4041645.1 unnamed protein product [Rotaria magnacalcarata]